MMEVLQEEKKQKEEVRAGLKASKEKWNKRKKNGQVSTNQTTSRERTKSRDCDSS